MSSRQPVSGIGCNLTPLFVVYWASVNVLILTLSIDRMLLNPILIPITLLITTTIIVNNVLRYRLHKRVLDSDLVNEELIKTMLKPDEVARDAFKWGLVCLFGGIGLVIIAFLPDQLKDSSLPYGIEAITISIGFLLYFPLSQRTFNKH